MSLDLRKNITNVYTEGNGYLTKSFYFLLLKNLINGGIITDNTSTSLTPFPINTSVDLPINNNLINNISLFGYKNRQASPVLYEASINDNGINKLNKYGKRFRYFEGSKQYFYLGNNREKYIQDINISGYINNFYNHYSIPENKNIQVSLNDPLKGTKIKDNIGTINENSNILYFEISEIILNTLRKKQTIYFTLNKDSDFPDISISSANKVSFDLVPVYYEQYSSALGYNCGKKINSINIFGVFNDELQFYRNSNGYYISIKDKITGYSYFVYKINSEFDLIDIKIEIKDNIKKYYVKEYKEIESGGVICCYQILDNVPEWKLIYELNLSERKESEDITYREEINNLRQNLFNRYKSIGGFVYVSGDFNGNINYFPNIYELDNSLNDAITENQFEFDSNIINNKYYVEKKINNNEGYKWFFNNLSSINNSHVSFVHNKNNKFYISATTDTNNILGYKTEIEREYVYTNETGVYILNSSNQISKRGFSYNKISINPSLNSLWYYYEPTNKWYMRTNIFSSIYNKIDITNDKEYLLSGDVNELKINIYNDTINLNLTNIKNLGYKYIKFIYFTGIITDDVVGMEKSTEINGYNEKIIDLTSTTTVSFDNTDVIKEILLYKEVPNSTDIEYNQFSNIYRMNDLSSLIITNSNSYQQEEELYYSMINYERPILLSILDASSNSSFYGNYLFNFREIHIRYKDNQIYDNLLNQNINYKKDEIDINSKWVDISASDYSSSPFIIKEWEYPTDTNLEIVNLELIEKDFLNFILTGKFYLTIPSADLGNEGVLRMSYLTFEYKDTVSLNHSILLTVPVNEVVYIYSSDMDINIELNLNISLNGEL